MIDAEWFVIYFYDASVGAMRAFDVNILNYSEIKAHLEKYGRPKAIVRVRLQDGFDYRMSAFPEADLREVMIAIDGLRFSDFEPKFMFPRKEQVNANHPPPDAP